MTIYSDNAGNKFLGDCIYANHDLNYLSTKFLRGYPYSDISAELTAWLTASGLKYRNVLSQSGFNTLATTQSIFAFSADSDIIDDRYSVNYRLGGGETNQAQALSMYNNLGFAPIDNSFSTTNSVVNMADSVSSETAFLVNNTGQTFTDKSLVTFAGVANNESLALFAYETNANRTINNYSFRYAGILEDVNTGFNYYSQNQLTKSILMVSQINKNQLLARGTIGIAHYIANNAKLCLSTGDAQYPIVCNDGQTPTSQWATDFYVFDNNATLGYPAIGKVRNLLLATGNYTIGKPVKLQGTVVPDNGFNRWLPVGTFANKTVLMRCYSSVEI